MRTAVCRTRMVERKRVLSITDDGRSEQIDRVTEIVAEARKKVYAILAED